MEIAGAVGGAALRMLAVRLIGHSPISLNGDCAKTHLFPSTSFSVAKDFAASAEDYQYSSARYYAAGKEDFGFLKSLCGGFSGDGRWVGWYMWFVGTRTTAGEINHGLRADTNHGRGLTTDLIISIF